VKNLAAGVIKIAQINVSAKLAQAAVDRARASSRSPCQTERDLWIEVKRLEARLRARVSRARRMGSSGARWRS
jgi:hypothetical protein